MNNFSCRSFFPCIAQYTHSQVIKQINYQILVVQQPLDQKERKNQERLIARPRTRSALPAWTMILLTALAVG